MSISFGSTSSRSRLALVLQAGRRDRAVGAARRRQDDLGPRARHRLGGEGEVPSPTFALMQRYETPRLTRHPLRLLPARAGRARRARPRRCAGRGRVSSIEWPERAASWLPATGSTSPWTRRRRRIARRIVLTGHGGWAARLERLRAAIRVPRPDALRRGGRALSARRRLDALLCAPRAAGPQRHPDELAAPARRTADPRRQAL